MTNSDPKLTGHLFNLIIYTHEEPRGEYFRNLVHSFIEKYPCRVIFIQGDKNANHDYLETGKVSEAINEVCDTLTIKASLSRLSQVPLVVLSYLVADLPIYLVWGQNPTSENNILPHLQQLASRLVYDCECAQDLQEFSKKMLSKIAELRIDFMDVKWAEISSWRDAATQVFLSPEKIQQLNQCRHLLIKFNKLDDHFFNHFATRAIYFQGWLAGQLKWKYQSISYDKDQITIHYKIGENNLEVLLQPQKRPTLSHGSLFEIEFQTPGGHTTTLSLAEKQAKILVYLSTFEKCELPYSLPYNDVQKGLHAMKEIFYYPSSVHYSNMLRSLSEITWQNF